MDSVGEGEGGKIWENDIETCKISCMDGGTKSPPAAGQASWHTAIRESVCLKERSRELQLGPDATK